MFRRSNLVLPLACAVVASSALAGEAKKPEQKKAPPQPQLQQKAPPRERGMRGAVLGEETSPTTTAPVTTKVVVLPASDPLSKTMGYLEARKATRIEDLSVDELEKTRRTTSVDAPWRQRLGVLATQELGRRGVTNDRFPSPAMPDEPTKRPPLPGMGADAIEIIARIVKGETWVDTPAEGEIAVASVILNRYLKKGFPKTIAGVAHQPFQFSCYNEDSRPTLYWGEIRPSAIAAAKAAIAGNDPVPGATHYFNPYLVSPSWADNLTFVRRVGNNARNTHDFYR